MIETSPFITEGAIEFGLAILAVIVRLFSIWKLVSFRKWGGDDYFCILAAVLLTVSLTPSVARKDLLTIKLQLLMVPIFLIGKLLGTNTGWTPEEIDQFDSGEIDRMETGSKLVIVGWIGYISVTRSLEGPALLYYNRIMSGVSQQISIRVCAGYCVLSYLALLLTIFLHCLPFSKNWQMRPDLGLNCSARYSVYIVEHHKRYVYHLHSDPPTSHQSATILVGALLGTGVFIIIAALIRCVLSLLNISSTNVTAVWAAREMVVAFGAVNAPAIKPLFNPSTWKSRSRRLRREPKTPTTARVVLEGPQKYLQTENHEGSGQRVSSQRRQLPYRATVWTVRPTAH
ncbi:hypothetical protein BJX63DRAFT_429045 [Aspergillus granulosus]|uniref:Uncharacterized protein n=1 Tax=Aspergillus granulosus TaxID=176169 RepID=A0ABR4HSS1_9EURO